METNGLVSHSELAQWSKMKLRITHLNRVTTKSIELHGRMVIIAACRKIGRIHGI